MGLALLIEQSNVKIWRSKILNKSIKTTYFIVDLFASLALLPICFFYALILRASKRNRLNTLLVAGCETSNNMRLLSSTLVSEYRQVYFYQFYSHPFYTEPPETPVIDISPSFVYSVDDRKRRQVQARFHRLFARKISLLVYLKKVDVFLFNWHESFFSANLDFLIIRLSGSSIIQRQCGSDFRYRPLHRAVNQGYGNGQWDAARPSASDLLAKLYRQLFAQIFATVLSSYDISTFQTRPLHVRPYVQPEINRKEEFLNNSSIEPGYRVLRVLHAPSDPNIKGTTLVREVQQMLKDSSIIHIEILESVPHHTVLEALSRSDVVVDQPGLFVARFATEACAAGCAVIGSDNHHFELKKAPFIRFPDEPQDLRRLLELLASDVDLLRLHQTRCKGYWLANSSPDCFRVYWRKLILGKAPTFGPRRRHFELMLEGANSRFERWVLLFAFWHARQYLI